LACRSAGIALYPEWVYANRLDSPKTFRTMREEQERADDRRDAAREMMKLYRPGKQAVRCAM